MQEETILLLPSDRQYAMKRIKELNEEIQALGPEFYDVFNQSSETWHDNAPFDALRDKQSLLDAERQNLKNILRKAAPSLPRQNKSITGIGCYVTVVDDTNKASKYFIAGDWTPKAGDKKNGAVIISRVAPIAEKILGHKVGYEFSFRNRSCVISAIEYEK